MRAEQKFTPVTLVFETQEEVNRFRDLLEKIDTLHISEYDRDFVIQISNLFTELVAK